MTAKIARSASHDVSGESAGAAALEPIALPGPQRAALILLVLGQTYGEPIWKGLSDAEIREVSGAMASLSTVSTDTLEGLLTDFITRIRGSAAVVGSYESTVNLLSQVMPRDRVQQLMEEIQGPAGRTTWEKLSNVDDVAFAGFLRKEYPQSVALILSRVSSSQAARVLGVLPEDFALEVVHRMLNLDMVRQDILLEVERSVNDEFLSQINRTRQRRSIDRVADIFNNFDRQTEMRMMTGIESANSLSAEKIRALMFTFVDFMGLSDNDIQLLIRNIDTASLAIALKGASPELAEKFLSNMSSRAANMLREDMEIMGPVRLKDVDQAQFAMVAKAKELGDSSQINLNKGDAEEMVG